MVSLPLWQIMRNRPYEGEEARDRGCTYPRVSLLVLGFKKRWEWGGGATDQYHHEWKEGTQRSKSETIVSTQRTTKKKNTKKKVGGGKKK